MGAQKSNALKLVRMPPLYTPLLERTVPSGYGLLWLLLDIVGLSLFRRQRVYVYCISKNVFIVLLMSMQVFFVSCSVRFIMAGLPAAPQISNVSVGLISMALWLSVDKKKRKLDSLIFQFHSMEELGTRKMKSLTFAINTFFAITLVIKIVCVLGYICSQTETSYTDYATSLITTKEKSLEIFIRLIITWLCTVVITFMPVLVTVLCGSVYFRCSQLLADFCGDITFQADGRVDFIRLSKRHRRLFGLTHSVEKRLSSVAFMLFCSQMLNMFVGLSSFTNPSSPAVIRWLCVPSLTIVPSTVLALTLSASRIRSKVRDIRTTLQNIRHSLVSKKLIEWESVAVVESMLETSFPTMTAYGIVELKPKLILSVFGSLFTYGFLVINMK